MTDTGSGIEWFLARDGQQYGPLSENEMRAFVDLGHLRPTDLIWRAGFPEWRPAPAVFAIHAPPPAPMPPVMAATAPASHEPSPVVDAGPVTPAELTIPAPAVVPAPAVAEPVRHEPELLSPGQLQSTTVAHHAPVVGAFAPTTAAMPQAAAPAAPELERVVPTASSPAPSKAANRAAPPRKPVRDAPVPTRITPDTHHDDDDDEEFIATPRRRSRILVYTAVLIVLASIGVTGYIMRGRIAALIAAAPATVASATLPASQQTPAVAVAVALTGDTPDAIDQNVQRLPVWRHIKSEFPEWYAERLKEAARLVAEKRGESAVARHLTEAIVTLRRKHADQALTASPERLKSLASAFLNNLQAMAKQNVETCYGFISQGETFPPVLDMMNRPDADGLQRQAVAVFDAIAEGRKTPQSYLPPRKADYDALAAELNARGWSEADLRTFSDPRALGRATPDQVCKMVQDWFAAQIAIKDPATQVRLLVESLRPVVAG